MKIPNPTRDLPARLEFNCVVRLLLFAVGILNWSPIHAQNLLQNGNFEQPLGPTNWTIVYIQGGPADFEIKDRTTVADRKRNQFNNNRGAHFRPSTDKSAHAYFSQTVTNLQPGHVYNITNWMRWEGGDASGFGNAAITYRVYFETVGGLGTNRSPDYPEGLGDAYDDFWLTNTPDAEGKIEVRLHLDKFRFCTYDKLILINGYFDDVSLTY